MASICYQFSMVSISKHQKVYKKVQLPGNNNLFNHKRIKLCRLSTIFFFAFFFFHCQFYNKPSSEEEKANTTFMFIFLLFSSLIFLLFFFWFFHSLKRREKTEETKKSQKLYTHTVYIHSDDIHASGAKICGRIYVITIIIVITTKYHRML